jgi:hypothetical protein
MGGDAMVPREGNTAHLTFSRTEGNFILGATVVVSRLIPVFSHAHSHVVLTPGGIDDAMDMYKNFRGKEPGIDPLLKNRGLK